MLEHTPEEKKRTKNLILASLRQQGFLVRDGQISLPPACDKEALRRLHWPAALHRIEQARPALQRHEERLLRYIANGSEVQPECIRPALVEVQPGSEYELLFRWACLHWSVPVSAGYGRRLRFVVIDESNGKLIGLIGLCDPVPALKCRDQWIGWSREARHDRLRYVVEAFVLGAVPPYAHLLCGKLMAMLLGSDEIREAFRHKYEGRQTTIRRRPGDGRIALITTCSALGRSSIYNRLKYGNRLLMEPIGFTSGYGEFHFSNGLYERLREYAEQHCAATAKRPPWGKGFRNKREVVRRVLQHLGLPFQWMNHQVRREVFAMPLAANTREFLRGEVNELAWYHQPAADLYEYFRERWLLPRAQRDNRWQQWQAEEYRLWGRDPGGNGVPS